MYFTTNLAMIRVSNLSRVFFPVKEIGVELK